MGGEICMEICQQLVILGHYLFFTFTLYLYKHRYKHIKAEGTLSDLHYATGSHIS